MIEVIGGGTIISVFQSTKRPFSCKLFKFRKPEGWREVSILDNPPTPAKKKTINLGKEVLDRLECVWCFFQESRRISVKNIWIFHKKC